MLSLHFGCWGPGKVIEKNIHLRLSHIIKGWISSQYPSSTKKREGRGMGQELGKESARKKNCRKEKEGNQGQLVAYRSISTTDYVILTCKFLNTSYMSY